MIELAAALVETLLLSELLHSSEHHPLPSEIASCSVTEQYLEPYSTSGWVAGASGCSAGR